ncbi:MAG: DNA mismatch repair protein MutS [Actinobacteria bacterium]|nr:DNA mismatch repair protein MutS [Actinomycetota bacterium]|tara:strand:- start:1727 stop:4183 length:2457 start_codon:yes stop_codon:yes gene_type:complete
MTISIDVSQQTPMIRQYLAIKEAHQDAILFFRLGDFYEMFFDDAKQASQELDLTLTGRGKDERRIPMCGVPYHAADGYISKLVDKGYKVAICEQVEEADDTKEITKRDVVKIVTPATHLSDTRLDSEDNIYLASLYTSSPNTDYGFSFVDCSTGEFKCCLFDSKQDLCDALLRLNPKECLVPRSLDFDFDAPFLLTHYDPLSINHAISKFNNFFSIHHLESFDLSNHELAIPSAWSIIDYLSHTQKHALAQLTTCSVYRWDTAMVLDAQSIRNLELLKPLFNAQKTGSLFWVINKTKTSLGARELKHWLLHPLTSIKSIEDRYDAIDYLKTDLLTREEIREQLHLVYDCERLLSRIVSHTHNPRDMIALTESLTACIELASILQDASGSLLHDSACFFQQLTQEKHPIRIMIQTIQAALLNPPPNTITAGNIIKPGYNEELDALTQSFKDIKDWIGGLEAKEQERTGIKTLRVGFNKVFGYYFQVSKGQTDHVPDDYIRKQTLTNAERYITPELKEKETVLLHGEEKQTQLEQTIYQTLVDCITKQTPLIQECAMHIARLDCLQCLATVAQQLNYTRPTLSDTDTDLKLVQSRHPVLEKQHPHDIISNDITFDNKTHILLITGPNMAGKSTLMKQVALTVILAQMGSFVPAESAHISLVDRCFTRIGASDNLSHGQSTFMVEMTETSTILHNATAKSLIILDEIGRGTSTYDGMSIAAAVIHYLHNHIQARTLFATHYHELTSITKDCDHVNNASMAINDDEGSLIFTYQLVAGPADKSYGIHVAEMAGLPKALIDHAQSLLVRYENTPPSADQLSLF